jgi:metallopeptidase MepB
VLRDTLFDHVSQFKLAENAEARRRAHEGYESRLAANVPLLDRAIGLRRKIADLLGYKTW